jgi:DNA modification methylase
MSRENGGPRERVLCGDSREMLRGLEDASVHAVVTDPPYALCERKDGTRGFMNATWDNGRVAHDPAFWAEVLRVAKPGAFLVAFGGTRTAHRLACAIEDAGWEIRDTLYLLWTHSQGFPKSLDVSKAIDRMAGAEREVLGRRKRNGGPAGMTADKGWHSGPMSSDDATVALTAPATDAARAWDGWGTALKPAAEPIVLARKPLSEPTVAANVLRHGTGALQIDACRVPTGESLNGGAYASDKHKQGGIYGKLDYACGDFKQPAGRWPPNVLLSHVSPGPDGTGGCVPQGTRRVCSSKRAPLRRGATTGTSVGGHGVYGTGAYHEGVAHYGDADGYEEVPAYSCDPSCPVRLLDEQAGVRTSGGRSHWTGESDMGTWRAAEGRSDPARRAKATEHAPSTGSASRFFPCFSYSAVDRQTASPSSADATKIAVPWVYIPKASRREREAGLEGMPASVRAITQRHVRGPVNTSKATDDGLRENRPTANTHPCVKPLSLMSWLVKLCCPVGGTVLDPFCGSGSTGVACVREGFGFVGIEMSEEYCEIARRRIAYEQEQQQGPLFAGCTVAGNSAAR